MLVLALLGCASDQEINRIPVAPDLWITAPEEPLRQGPEPAWFEGGASDEHDSPEQLELRWSLDGEQLGEPFHDDDGELELELDVDALALGEHLLTLRGLDSDGQSAQAEATFELLGPLGAPEAHILSPLDGDRFELGELVVFHGAGSDSATAPEDLRFSWSSDLDGALAGEISEGGESVLLAQALSAGVHGIQLQVEDADGQLGEDRITIEVMEESVEAEPGDLVLSELMVNPAVVEDTSGEWFELYNTSGSPIDIQGYTLRDLDYDTWVIDLPMLLPAHSYFLLCAETDPALNGGVEGCDARFLRPQLPPPGMALGNDGDEVILVRPDGVEIDRLVYTGSWVATGVSVGVDPSALNEVDNNDIDNWCRQTTVMTSGGEPSTPGVENDPCW